MNTKDNIIKLPPLSDLETLRNTKSVCNTNFVCQVFLTLIVFCNSLQLPGPVIHSIGKTIPDLIHGTPSYLYFYRHFQSPLNTMRENSGGKVNKKLHRSDISKLIGL